MKLEPSSLDPLIERRCADCETALTDAEVRASLDAGGPFVCAVHAAEEVALDEPEIYEAG